MPSKASSFAATHGAKPPRRRKSKKPSPTSEPTSISSLPYDLLLHCIARISRSYYPTLSLVSKNFLPIVTSPELYTSRSLLNRTESCLYLCLRNPLGPTQYWFTLCRKPDSSWSSRRRFIQIPSPHLPPAESASLVSVGSNIYKIGGSTHPSSLVSVLDCRFNTWHEAPRMRVKRRSPAASVVDGKVYVAGGCEDVSSSSWVEVFDPKTQTWGSMTNPSLEARSETNVQCLGLGGKLYLLGDEYVTYNPKEDRWEPEGSVLDVAFAVYFHHGMVGDVLFLWDDGDFNWYDTKAKLWKKLNGVEEVTGFWVFKMVDLGGNLAVLWDGYLSDSYIDGYLSEKKVIWCAEISLEMREGDELWGNVEWYDVVLTLDESMWRCNLSDGDALCAYV